MIEFKEIKTKDLKRVRKIAVMNALSTAIDFKVPRIFYYEDDFKNLTKGG